MRHPCQLLAVMAAGCLLAMALPAPAATPDDEEIKALKDAISKLSQRLDALEKARAQDARTLEQNQKVHEQDQQEVQRLKQQLQETQKTATDAQQKAEAASQVQPVHPLPEGRPAAQNFMVVGDAEVQFGKTDGEHGGFALADFAPIFLFRGGDRVLFEAGADIMLGNGPTGPGGTGGSGTSFGISFATLDYLLNDYATFVGGYMLLPLGTYAERSAGWLNKIPDDPLPRAVVPGQGAGAQLRGAIPIGQAGQSLAYSVYAANGPSSIDGSGTSTNLDLGGNIGLNGNGDFMGNLHGTPAAGGRIGWFFPLKACYDLELGISGQTGPWDNAERRLWSAAALDAALHVGPWVEVKGEYIRSWVETDDIGTFRPRGWWVQGGFKLASLNLDLPVINNVELVGRYDNFQDGLGTKADRYTVGYVYYLTSSLLFEGDYEFASSNNNDFNHNRLIFQLSYGF